jgi:ADP-ribosylglycohydrolase
MLGAIIGDIVGSVYEWDNIKTKEFTLFKPDCFFTDDTVMTLAVAEGLMKGGTGQDYVAAMKKYGRLYPDAGYGGHFYDWIFSDKSEPYNSWGNGSAMRVSPVAWAFDTLEEVEEAAAVSAGVTHNHPEGIRGTKATAACIFWARQGMSIPEIREACESRYGYDLHQTLKEIRPDYEFDVSCQGTVPQAIIAFLESEDFEDAIRNAISLGGDSDTLAAITGSIAEAYYGIPRNIREEALSYLDETLLEVWKEWQAYHQISQVPSRESAEILSD